MITYNLDINSTAKPLEKYWEMCVGSCHAATALREDYRRMLKQCRNELGFKYLRFHGIFDDDMSVVKKPLFSDETVFSFANIDNIYDFLLSIGMKPFVELSFMPGALASGSATIFNYKGNTTPPKNYEEWSGFIKAFIDHILERYGRSEVRQWYFEIWNEPNLGGLDSQYGFWAADKEEYFKLYNVTAQAVKSCDSSLKVGGPATSNNAWISDFLNFCESSGAPVDFVSTHHYPTDVVLGYGVEDSANFVNPLNIGNAQQVQNVMRMAREGGEEFENFKNQYSVFQSHLWEHVERGVLTDMAMRALSETRGLPLFYTEWGSLAGLQSDSDFGSSFIAKTVLDSVGLTKCYSFWTFCDIIEESGQNSEEFFGGFGLMTQHGIPKAPYRAFELLHKLEGQLYDNICRSDTVDVYAVKNDKTNALQLLAVNHNSLLHDIDEQEITINILNAQGCIDAEVVRVDKSHGNACERWLADGSKQYLTCGEIETLKGASEIRREAINVENTRGEVQLKLALPPMGMALITVYFG